MSPDVMFPEEQQQIALVCQRLHRDANAKAVLLIGRDGQPIAEAGEVGEIDVTSLSSLTAGNVAATGGISKILREKDFTSQFHEGEKTHVHITLVGGRAILVVLFDERSSLGLVRLRPLLAYLLPDLQTPQRLDHPPAEDERDEERRHGRVRRPERHVLKDVQRLDEIRLAAPAGRERLEEPFVEDVVDHLCRKSREL